MHFTAIITLIPLIILGGTTGLIIFAIGTTFTLFLVAISTRSFGGITGDVLGSTNELTRHCFSFGICFNMIGIIMAGGKGSRMKIPEEKLLLKYKKPIILQVAEALSNSKCFSKIIFITSPNSPRTKQLLQKNNYEIFDTSGIGYVEDLNFVLKSLNDPVFITSADLPLLDSEIIKKL